jgi:hypothetical protein
MKTFPRNRCKIQKLFNIKPVIAIGTSDIEG